MMFQHIHALAVFSEDPDQPALFAGTDAGLFYSQDAGQHWVNALDPGGPGSPSAIAALQACRFADGQTFFYAGGYGGVYRAAGLRAAWEAIPFGQPAPVITALCASQDQYLHAATLKDGVFTSTDRGRHWTRWNFGLLDWRVYALAAARLPDGTPALFAGTETGIYSSRNNGRTWRETSFPDSGGAVLSLSAAPGGQALFAGTANGSIYGSPDGGGSWSLIYEDPQGAEIPLLLPYAGGDGVCAAAGGRILATGDAGKNWQVWYSAPEPGSSITALAASAEMPTGARLWVARDDGSLFHLRIA